MPADSDLDAVYSLETPAEHAAHYDQWSSDYDKTLIGDLGYVAPANVASVFKQRFSASGPILDIGAGTGLVAESLRGLIIDGVDISPKMLEVARSRGIYRDLIEADLTARLPLPDETYDGFVSAGTFTHGHVGPDALNELLRVAKQGALFCTGTISTVFDQAGFGSKFAQMVAHGLITPVEFVEVNIYEGATHEHADDKSLVAIFHKI